MKTYSANPTAIALANRAAAILGWPRVSVVRRLSGCRIEAIVDGEPKEFTGILAVQIGNVLTNSEAR